MSLFHPSVMNLINKLPFRTNLHLLLAKNNKTAHAQRRSATWFHALLTSGRHLVISVVRVMGNHRFLYS